MIETGWHGCYKDGWQGLIVSDAMTQPAQGALFDRGEDYSAFEHPAKVSRALSRRIYAHLRDVYGLQPGALVLDPFAGVGCFALDAILGGYHFIGVELEPKFHTLALKNLAYWRHKYGALPGSATILQGDSRQLRAVLGQAQVQGLVSSPPYAGTINASGHGIDWSKTGPSTGNRRRGAGTQVEATFRAQLNYGDNMPGQLGAMPVGEPPAALISSPCYAGKGEILGTHDGVDYSKCKHGGRTQTRGRAANSAGYGDSPGNLGAMPTGQPPDALISSPPYANGLGKEDTYADPAKREKDSHRRIMREKHIADPFYGDSPGNLGNMPVGALVSSPPYADGCAHTGGMDSHSEHIQGGKQGVAVGYVVSSPPYAASLSDTGNRIDRSKMTYADGRALTATSSGPLPQTSYGSEPGNLGNASPTTFWAASLQILHECYAVLAPGAIAVWVVKPFARHKAIVDFPGQWQQACEIAGFVLLERIEASLVTKHGVQETLFGAPVVQKTKRMSYFRGDYERKHPDLAINAEIVLILRKPH